MEEEGGGKDENEGEKEEEKQVERRTEESRKLKNEICIFCYKIEV